MPPTDVGHHLTASPLALNFGITIPPATRNLAVVLTNDGHEVTTITGVYVEPLTAPFRVESLGYGPFWIRPGRSREIFITFAPTTTLQQAAQLRLESQAANVLVQLLGN